MMCLIPSQDNWRILGFNLTKTSVDGELSLASYMKLFVFETEKRVQPYTVYLTKSLICN